MIDPRLPLDDPGRLARGLERRRAGADVAALVQLAQARRSAVQRFEALRSEQNTRQQAVKDAPKGTPEFRAMLAGLKDLSEQVKEADGASREAEAEYERALLYVPNLPDELAPDGADASGNRVVRSWGAPRPDVTEAHDDIGTRLGILDLEGASRTSGARFALMRGWGARLERALGAFMLDLHTGVGPAAAGAAGGAGHGYTELLPPFLVTRASMTGTGQLPKFEEDAFRTAGTPELFLVPTAEVPVTNLHRGQVLEAEALPVRYAAWTPCFRREAGGYGRDTKGLIRLHQFTKVELVWFCAADASEAAHETLTGHAEAVLKALELPFRTVDLCTGDLGFAAARCYDLEVWLPSQGQFREISSCSNFRDFQARRADIRYRPEPGGRPRFVHTLNGSGVAIGRCLAALLENHVQPDGTVRIPEVLAPYLGTDRLT